MRAEERPSARGYFTASPLRSQVIASSCTAGESSLASIPLSRSPPSVASDPTVRSHVPDAARSQRVNTAACLPSESCRGRGRDGGRWRWLLYQRKMHPHLFLTTECVIVCRHRVLATVSSLRAPRLQFTEAGKLFGE